MSLPDVYKRQGITCYRIAVNGKLPGIDQRRSQAPVSYTHLDVYKRQNLIFDAVVPFGFRLTDQEVEQKIRSAVRALDGALGSGARSPKNHLPGRG